MTLQINNREFDIPFNLASVTLARFLSYYESHGKDLDEELKVLSTKKYEGTKDEQETDRILDYDLHIDKEALAWLSFHTGIDITGCAESPGIAPVLRSYRVLRSMMEDDTEEAAKFPMVFDWEGDIWEVRDYQVTPESDMTFNEVITSKEIVRQVMKINAGKWAALPHLCCVFLRKKGEDFSDDLVHANGARYQQMLNLPMNIAMSVAFFLGICVPFFRRTLVSS